MKKTNIGLIVLLLAAWAAAACHGRSAVRVREREDLLLLRDRLARTEGRLEALEMEYQRLMQDMHGISASAAKPAPNSAARRRLDALEQRLAALDAARERDRRAIVDQLSGGSPKSCAPAAAGRPQRQCRRRRGVRAYRAAGRNLSAIAGAA